MHLDIYHIQPYLNLVHGLCGQFHMLYRFGNKDYSCVKALMEKWGSSELHEMKEKAAQLSSLRGMKVQLYGGN